MSSTKRSKVRDFHVADYYVTPVAEIVSFLREFRRAEPRAITPQSRILDPCAGGDAKHAASYPVALAQLGLDSGTNILTVDLRADSLAAVKGDYLAMSFAQKFDVVITNPPFLIAERVIRKALEDVRDGGWVVMLLRVNFFGGKIRRAFFDSYPPAYCFVHRNRMSFTDDGRTDSIEYGHMCWRRGEHPEFTKLRIVG